MIAIEQITKEDIIQDYITALNNPEINKYLNTKEATKESIMRYIKSVDDSNGYMFKVIKYIDYHRHDKEFMIGTATLKNIDWNIGSADIGVMVWELGKGYGSLAILEIIKFCKNTGLIKLNLGVNPSNYRAIKCYKNLGFKETEILMELDLNTHQD